MSLNKEIVKKEPGASGTFKRFKALASKYKNKEKDAIKSMASKTKKVLNKLSFKSKKK